MKNPNDTESCEDVAQTACSDAEQQRGPCQRPLGGLVPGLEVEGPHEGGPPLSGLVHRALVNVARLLLVLGDGAHVDDGHQGEQLLVPRVHDAAQRHVPARALHVQPVYVGALSRRGTKTQQGEGSCTQSCS